MRRTAPLLLTTLLLTGCASGGPAPSVSTPAATPTAAERSDVPWNDYADDVKTRIDDMEAAADCEGLQAEFDIADANSDRVAERTDHNNALLMGYIDEAMQLAGCYD